LLKEKEMPVDPSHWSQDRKSFGYNIPADLTYETLEEVQDELAAAGLEVEMGETQVIITQEENADLANGRMAKFPNGDVQVYTRKTQKRSSDGGRTWRQVNSQFSGYACQTTDGEIIQFTGLDADNCYYTFEHQKSAKEGWVETVAWLLRSGDSGLTETREQVRIYLPEKLRLNTLNHARIVVLRDGSLLTASYGRHEDDPTVTFETWVTKKGQVGPRTIDKARVFAMRSADGGATWHYLSTVAFDLTKHTELRTGGFNESDLLALPSGEILCFMRTVCGGAIKPMYMNMSNDDGKTWCIPDPVAERGVCAYACLMDSGVIAVIYGRPGNWLMFSVDDGQHWLGRFQFYMGPKAYDAWNYCALDQVAPDTLLAVYGRTDPCNQKAGEIAGTFFTVRRRG